MTLGQPAGVGGAAQALLDAAVARVDVALARASGGTGQISEEEPGVVMQARLIAFERAHMIRALRDDARGDGLLRPHGVDGDDRAFDVEHLQEIGYGGDLVGLSVDGALRQHEAGVGGVGRDQMQRAGSVRLPRSAQRLAVHGDDLAGERAH